MNIYRFYIHRCSYNKNIVCFKADIKEKMTKRGQIRQTLQPDFLHEHLFTFNTTSFLPEQPTLRAQYAALSSPKLQKCKVHKNSVYTII